MAITSPPDPPPSGDPAPAVSGPADHGPPPGGQAGLEAPPPPASGRAGRLAALGNLGPLRRLAPLSRDPARRGALVLAGAAILLASALSFVLLPPAQSPPAQDPAVLDTALSAAWNWVDGSEAAPIHSRPPWMDSLAASGPTGAALAQGVAQFLDLRFQEALQSFQAVSGGADPDPRLLSLLAAANLRLLNYGQASALYSQALSLSGAPPEKGGLKEASDRLGLALALFHQPDYERSLAEAGISWRIRHQMLGPADSKTLAAANSMATSLMALSRSAVAGDLLIEAVAQAIDGGADQSQPVVRDSLGILYLAFEAQGRVDELKALFQAPGPAAIPAVAEPPPAAPSGPGQPQAPPPFDREVARNLVAGL
ncbi:MAG: hypothetical protein LBL95_09990, partial [Deltaproteobacteria bacterium]|nr:hypothetical protein [Deltaproteobacteria bacterium]